MCKLETYENKEYLDINRKYTLPPGFLWMTSGFFDIVTFFSSRINPTDTTPKSLNVN